MMRGYTTVEQSKVLAEILPIESADMYYWCGEQIKLGSHRAMDKDLDIPCWSLAALLGVLPSASLDSSDDHYFRLHCNGKFSEWHDNPVDAAFEMIELLHKENLI